MDNLQTYLDNRLKTFKKSCDTWLADYKQALHSEHNQFLINKIKEAEESIEKGKKTHVDMFNKSMESLAKQRLESSHPGMQGSFDMWENSLKKQLDNSLNFTEKNWKSFIEDCKAQIK